MTSQQSTTIYSMTHEAQTIHTTMPGYETWLSRPAIHCTMSLAKNPHASVGKRVTVFYWLDTDELELKFITGTYADVVIFDREVIPNGTIKDAQAFARLHLLGEDSK
jgi:hypothetical protein